MLQGRNSAGRRDPLNFLTQGLLLRESGIRPVSQISVRGVNCNLLLTNESHILEPWTISLFGLKSSKFQSLNIALRFEIWKLAVPKAPDTTERSTRECRHSYARSTCFTRWVVVSEITSLDTFQPLAF